MNRLAALLGGPHPICDRYDSYLKLGSGSYGTVYELFVGTVSTGMVLKIYDDKGHPRDRRRFLREIDMLLQLQGNAYVIDILEYSKEYERPWYTMPMASETLYDYVRRLGTNMDEDESYTIIDSVLLALEDAHEQGILHRDLAPSNILLFLDSEPMEVRVGDFGLGRNFSTGSKPLSRSADNQLGHEAFTAPEQLLALKDATIQSDLYSVGAVLSFMLTGGMDPRLQKPTSAIRVIINDCMRKNPVERPCSAAELREHIQLCRGGSTRVRNSVDDLMRVFQLTGGLNQEELLDLSNFLVKTQFYDRGRQTYSLYFQPILRIPRDVFGHWLAYSEREFVNTFVENYCAQIDLICSQVGWPFSSMTEIGDLMMFVFHNYNDQDVRVRILTALIDNHPGFGELSPGLEAILTAHFTDEILLSALATVLRLKRHQIMGFFRNIEGKVKHLAFVEIFD